MSVLIFSIVVGFLKILNTQPAVSYAEMGVTYSVISSPVDEQPIHSISYFPAPQRFLLVPALTRCSPAQQPPLTLSQRSVSAEGPTCTPVPSFSPSVSNAREPVLFFPLTEEGIREGTLCVPLPVPQSYCEIPSGSLISAFPLV